MKKLLFLSVLLLSSIIASAADFTIDGICYNITSTNPLTVEVAYSDSYSGDIVIPEKVEYEGKEYSVTSIGNSAFEHTGLTSLTIPNSVTSIGEWAFDGCDGLTSVTIPESVTSIESRALCNCDGLTTIVVENGNTVFDSRDNCNAIIRTADNELIAGCKNTTIPNSVTTIGESAFLWCCMSSITIPNSVTTIKDEAFFDCYGLTSMTIPSSVTSIGNRAFQACSSLTSLTIPESVTNIGVDAFRGCSGLTSIIVKSGNNIYDSRDNSNAIIRTADNKLILGCQNTIIPENVTSIGENAFDECGGLVSITIPNKVTTIEEGAFRKCYNLKSVTIPSSVTNIGRFAFEGCNSLTIIVVDSGNTVYDSRDNCNAIIRTSDNQLIAGCHGTIIPNSVTSIGYSAFALFNNLTTITIPNSVKSIGNFAFYYCTGLTSVTIPNSVTSIGNSAFSNCPSLTEVISMIEEPFAIRSNCWDRVNTQEIPLYVPAGTKEKYENTEGWNVFKNIVETGNVITHQCPDDNHPHMIDLGLPSGTKWACCNVGASKPEDYGGYYAWGEIEEKDVYDWSMYIHWDENAGACNDIGSDISGTDYDVAHVKWSGSWVMPSIEQYRELRSNTTAEWTTENGVNGFRFTSSNGRAIFLPDAGFRWESGLYDKGCYWCSSSNWSEGLVYADMMTFEDGKMWDGANLRYRGIPVRPVVAGSSTPSGITIDETTFPDKNFRNWVLAQEYGQDGVLTEDEISGVTNIKIVRKNISNLIGIEYFTALTRLDVILCRQLTSLDVSKNTALRELICYSNSLTSLDVSKNTELTLLNCHENQLTSLVLPKNGALKELECYKNQIEGTAMDALIASLPETGGKLYAIMPGDNEKNVVTMEQVAAAKEKGWKTYYYSDDDGWVDYKIIPEGNIDFADPAVKALCVANWDTDGDGELSYAEAAAVGDLGDVFRYNQEITSFNELQYFIGLTWIRDWAFSGTYLTSIIIPDNVSYIGQYAFGFCYNLTSVTIPNSVTTIGENAFGYCNSLTSVTIPNSVTSIGYSAFKNCSGLTSVTIPKSVTTIGDDAFQYCGGLTSIKVENGNPKYDSRDNCNALIETESNTLIVGCMNTVIPNSVTTIGKEAFYNCRGLTSVTIPNSVTNIEDGAFIYCNLASIKVESGNTRYDSRDNCNAIIETESNTLVLGCMNTIIPNSVTSIASGAFGGSSLTSLTIPNSVTNIEDGAFIYCNLASIKVESGNTRYDSRDNCNAIIETESNTLVLGCMNTIIPNSVTSIGSRAFFGSSLTSLTIPNSVTTIGDEAFSGCLALEEVTIGSGVTKIGNCAFEYCRGLKEIRSMITDPFTCEIDYSWLSFGPSLAVVILYVPAGTKEKYESTPNWNYFQNIVEMDISPVNEGETIDIGKEIDENTNLDGNVVGDVYYSISSGDGNYDAAEGCLVVTKPTDDSAIDGQDIFGEDFKDNYTGIVFKLAPGKGSIKVEAETQGNMVLKVKIGNSEPIEMELDGKLKVKFPYNVSEPTYVYIYGGMGAAGAKAMGANRAKSAADLLKIYGLEIVSDPSGIDAIENGKQADAPVYNLNGQRVNTPSKGVYIKNGRKVIVK